MGRRTVHWMATGLLAALAIGGGASAASAAPADDPSASWDSSSLSVPYGEYWQFSAVGTTANEGLGPWVANGAMDNTPAGYTPGVTAFQSGPDAVSAYVTPQGDARPLGAGTYPVYLTLTETNGTGPSYPAPSATLTITPAALTVTLAVVADPSNPTNAIISADLTGPFRDTFYTASYTPGPLSPAGDWRIEVKDEDGQVVHESDSERTDTQDILGVSSYWSGVAPGTYTVRATFTTTGESSQNFTITQASPVTYTAAPAPGATSTAAPAPPAPPPAADEAGLTLPGWIPLIAGILSAGLIALLIVQIVRLRRAGALPEPVAPGGELR